MVFKIAGNAPAYLFGLDIRAGRPRFEKKSDAFSIGESRTCPSGWKRVEKTWEPFDLPDL